MSGVSDSSLLLVCTAGISLTSTGCSVFVLNRYSDVVSVYHNISIDSLWSLLISDGSRAPVVYMHWPLDQPKVGGGRVTVKNYLAYDMHSMLSVPLPAQPGQSADDWGDV